MKKILISTIAAGSVFWGLAYAAGRQEIEAARAASGFNASITGFEFISRGIGAGGRGSRARQTSLTSRIKELADRVAPKVVEWRRDFHMYPELSNREEQTAAKVAERLREIGVDDIKTGVARYGVAALIKGKLPGPTVALRADMDGLPIQEETNLPFASKNPGVMQSCGHDSHMAVLLGTAQVLTQMRDEIHGTVKVIFQPAEEGAPWGEEGGAGVMVREGVLRDPNVSAIMALHAMSFPGMETGKIGYTMGGALASAQRFKIVVHGKGTHGAAPWRGIDPVYISARIIEGLQSIVSRENDPREPVVVTVGMVKGGTRNNIIPDTVEMEGTIRALDEKARLQVLEAFDRIVRHTAAAHRATVDIEFGPLIPITVNNPELGKSLLPTLESVVGAGNVLAVKPVTGAEDFSFYAREIPGFFIWLGVRNEAVGATEPNHTSRFILDEAALPLGVRAMTAMALDYLRAHAKDAAPPST